MTQPIQHCAANDPGLLAESIKRDIRELSAREVAEGNIGGGIRNAGSFQALHNHIDANTLGNTEEVWESLTKDIPPEGDEAAVQHACDVVNAAQTIVDEWLKAGRVDEC